MRLQKFSSVWTSTAHPVVLLFLISTAIVLATASPIPQDPVKVPARAAKAGGRLKPEFQQPVVPQVGVDNERPKLRDTDSRGSSGVGRSGGGFRRSGGISRTSNGHRTSFGRRGGMKGSRGSRIGGRGRGGGGGKGGGGGGGRGGGRGRG